MSETEAPANITCSHCGEAINPEGYWIVQVEDEELVDGSTHHSERTYHEDCAGEYPEDERTGVWTQV
jgi:hypothetical protein